METKTKVAVVNANSNRNLAFIIGAFVLAAVGLFKAPEIIEALQSSNPTPTVVDDPSITVAGKDLQSLVSYEHHLVMADYCRAWAELISYEPSLSEFREDRTKADEIFQSAQKLRGR